MKDAIVYIGKPANLCSHLLAQILSSLKITNNAIDPLMCLLWNAFLCLDTVTMCIVRRWGENKVSVDYVILINHGAVAT